MNESRMNVESAWGNSKKGKKYVFVYVKIKVIKMCVYVYVCVYVCMCIWMCTGLYIISVCLFLFLRFAHMI